MAQLVKMIKDRQGDMSIEEYANKMGIRGATLSRYYNKEREISIDIVRRLAQFYRKENDTLMLEALSSYALGNGSSSSPN